MSEDQRPLTAAEIAKIEAETLKVATEIDVNKATVEKTLAEQRKLDAETIGAANVARKCEADAVWAELAAAEKRIVVEQAEEKRASELAGDKYHHTYLFDTEVLDTSVRKCTRQLTEWERHANGESLTIELVIDSPGGGVFEGFSLFDFIKSMQKRGHTVNTTAYGKAASMGSVLLAVGNERRMGENAFMLIHEASFGAMGSYGEIEDRVKLVDLMQDRILSILSARSDLSPAQIKRRWQRTDWWLTAEQSLAHGLIDSIV